MREQKTKAEIKIEKKKHEIITTTSPLTHILILINHPPPIPSPHHSNNNTIVTESLVQVRQSNKCGSVRNNEILDLNLGSGASP